MSGKNRITINLDHDKYQALMLLSNELDVSLAWLGRKAFADLLVKYDRCIEEDKNSPVTSKLNSKLVNGA